METEHSDSTQRIGDFLVRIGAMTADQVSQVLKKQKSEPDRLFGELAIELGFIDDGAVDRYLQSKRSD